MSTETFTPDRLIAGCCDCVTDSGTLVSGQNLTRGALLGKITTGGKLTLCNSAAVDGSAVPYAILAASVDASGGDKVCSLYKAGEFNDNAITFGGSDTAATHKEALRDVGIYLKSPVKA
jgi:hypothetical protein